MLMIRMRSEARKRMAWTLRLSDGTEKLPLWPPRRSASITWRLRKPPPEVISSAAGTPIYCEDVHACHTILAVIEAVLRPYRSSAMIA